MFRERRHDKTRSLSTLTQETIMKNIIKNVSDLLNSKEPGDRYSTPATRQYYFRYER